MKTDDRITSNDLIKFYEDRGVKLSDEEKNENRKSSWRRRLMAKINIRIPEPKEEYDISNQKQINRSLTLMKRSIKFYIFK